MKKIFKRTISLTLCVLMVAVSFNLSLNVYAESAEPSQSTASVSMESENLDANVLAEEVEERQEGDFSPITAGFDDGKNPLVQILEDNGQYYGEIVDDPTGAENKVFAMALLKGRTSAMWQINDKLWPKGSAQVTKFSFKFYSKSLNNFTTPYFIYDYTDVENFNAVSYQGNTGSYGGIQKRILVDGLETNQLIQNRTIIFEEWMEMTFTFTGTKGQVMLSTSEQNVVSSINFTAGSRIAFGFISTGHLSEVVYIDDVNIEFEEGDFDLNERNYDVIPYYQGNTFQKPDDTVLLTGDSYFAQNVESAQLYALPDTVIDATNPEYIFETRFNKSEVNEGVITEPSQATWNAESASEVEFVQKTKTSVKFVLPEADKKSIYAVKLNASNKQLDDEGNRLYEDKIIYLNNPYVSYTMGDDGEISTAGGSLRIIGENLYIDNAHTVTVVAKSVETGAITPMTITKMTDGDAYSLEVSIPEDMQEGKYEIYVHNGYGDNTCWSSPVVFTVGASARSVWRAKGVFNVKDYGAVGDDTANDTPAVIMAIEAAHQNGGGIVYFPAGKYRLISTIVVPQNVSLEGHAVEDTMLFWTAYTWQYGEANKLISISGNCEIKNFNIYASRCPEVIYTNTSEKLNLYNKLFGDTSDKSKDNIYIENIMIRNVPVAGNITNGGNGWQTVSGVTKTEMETAVEVESQTHKIYVETGGKNLQFSNIDMMVESYNRGMDCAGIMVRGYYVNVNDFSSECYRVTGNVRNAIVEDCFFEHTAIGINGTNMYYARNNMEKHYSNNRELWVSDGVPYYRDVRIQFVGEREDIMGAGNTDNITYRLLNYPDFDKNAFEGYEVFVADGQGYGQVRSIVSCEADGTFKIDQPFTIEPNRNSSIWVYWPRTTNYFVQNEFVEGSGGGPYGTSIDSVWDGNTFSYHNGQLFTNGSTVIWYTTILNEVYKNPLYIHGEGYGGIVAGAQTDCKIFLNLNVAKTQASFMGTVIKDNDFCSYYIDIQGSLNEALRDLVVEHNVMEGSPYGIKYDVRYSTYFDGLYIRNNYFDTSGQTYSDILMNPENNKLGYKRCIIISDGEDEFILGDVNLDGKVSLKDSSLIICYYIGTVQLTEEQLLRADVNEDGEVNLKDSTRIKQHILTGAALGKVEFDYYPGVW